MDAQGWYQTICCMTHFCTCEFSMPKVLAQTSDHAELLRGQKMTISAPLLRAEALPHVPSKNKNTSNFGSKENCATQLQLVELKSL